MPARRTRRAPGPLALAGLLASTLAVVLVGAPAAIDQAAPPAEAQATSAAPALAARSRPNVVVVMTDDMTASDLRWMPRTRRLLGRVGTTFTDAVAPNPLCCPARAAFITGLESHNSGVWTNKGPAGGYKALHRHNLLPLWLKRAGYRTAFLGKHLNGYRPDRAAGPERGWTIHDPLMRGIYSYLTFTSWNDGRPHTVEDGYVTRYLAQRTSRVLRRFEKRDARPFFLWVAHVAPHAARKDACQRRCWRPPIPERRDRGDFARTPAPSRSSEAFNRDGGDDKPFFLRDNKLLDERKLQRQFSRRIASLQSVDRSVAATVERLRRLGELKRTLIVFTSDNGFVLGEHRYVGKRLPYRTSLRVPLLVRGPGVRRGARVRHLVTTPDLTRTIVQVSGAQPPYALDGVGLRRLLTRRGVPAPRDATIVQTGLIATDRPGWLYRGYRDKRYTYARYPDDGSGSPYEELYDRDVRPSEVDNVADDPAYAEVLQQVRARAVALHDCSGSSCHPDWGPLPAPDR